MLITARRRRLASLALLPALVLGLALVTGAPSGADPGGSAHRDGQIVVPVYDPTLDDLVAVTVNPDGSDARQIWPFVMECPHWSPDGSQIASCGTPQGDGTTILDVDTGQARLLPFLRPDLFSPCYVWAPDARRLACEGAGETDPSLNGIYSVRIRDWSDVRRLTVNPGGDDIPGDYSPDGHSLVFARYDATGAPVGLDVVAVNGQHRLTQLTPVGSDVSSTGTWSPRGGMILFSRHVTGDVRQTIWSVNADGSDLHQVAVDLPCGGSFDDPGSIGCSQPAWSPSGRQFAFLVNSATGRDLYVVDADGSDPQPLGVPQADETPDWGTHPSTTAQREAGR